MDVKSVLDGVGEEDVGDGVRTCLVKSANARQFEMRRSVVRRRFRGTESPRSWTCWRMILVMSVSLPSDRVVERVSHEASFSSGTAVRQGSTIGKIPAGGIDPRMIREALANALGRC